MDWYWGPLTLGRTCHPVGPWKIRSGDSLNRRLNRLEEKTNPIWSRNAGLSFQRPNTASTRHRCKKSESVTGFALKKHRTATSASSGARCESQRQSCVDVSKARFSCPFAGPAELHRATAPATMRASSTPPAHRMRIGRLLTFLGPIYPVATRCRWTGDQGYPPVSRIM